MAKARITRTTTARTTCSGYGPPKEWLVGYMAALGKRGGKSRSPKKRAAVKGNLPKARAARRRAAKKGGG